MSTKLALKKAKMIETELVEPAQEGSAGTPARKVDTSAELTIQTRMSGVAPASMVGWLKAAVPAYLRTRERLVKEATLIGVVLIMVRDFSPRGTLETVKKLIGAGRSTRSLDRCIALAQACLRENNMLCATSHKLIESPQVAALVMQSEFDFEKSKHPLVKLIDRWAADRSMADLLEGEALGEDADAPALPESKGGGRKKLSKAEAQRAAFSDAFASFKKVWACGREHLFNKDLIKVEMWLTKALDVVKVENKKRQRAEAAAGATTRKGK